jgi:hypothetical protein
MGLAPMSSVCRALVGTTDWLAAGRGRLWVRYSHLRSDRGVGCAAPPFPKEPDPSGSPRLLWATRRRFDPSSSPSAIELSFRFFNNINGL